MCLSTNTTSCFDVFYQDMLDQEKPISVKSTPPPRKSFPVLDIPQRPPLQIHNVVKNEEPAISKRESELEVNVYVAGKVTLKHITDKSCVILSSISFHILNTMFKQRQPQHKLALDEIVK